MLMSSFQIWMASSAGLPLAESPPVRAMPKPILIGSAARATNAPALASTTSPMTVPIRTQVRIGCLQGCFIAPSLLRVSRGSAPVGRRAKTAPVASTLSRR